MNANTNDSTVFEIMRLFLSIWKRVSLMAPTDPHSPPPIEDTDRDNYRMRRIEIQQSDALFHLGSLTAESRLLEAGSGRGDDCFRAHKQFGCHIMGIDIDDDKVQFASRQAAMRGVQQHVQFRLRSMHDTGFASKSLSAIWASSIPVSINLHQLFREFARLLEPRGRCLCITDCHNDKLLGRSAAIERIDQHRRREIHPRSTLFRAMSVHCLVPISVIDLTTNAISFWESRARSPRATGIEEAFLTAYREGSLQRILIAADRLP